MKSCRETQIEIPPYSPLQMPF